jgi:nicotinamide-nucleotide amidase
MLVQIKFFQDKVVPMKASILAIGTELTTGQIINKNASDISEKLKKFGIEVTMHLTVPDDRRLIQESLHHISQHSDLLFITGGLGPTTDDFTREVVAAWAGLELCFDEGSWQHIHERLSARGFQVRAMQRQQCYFPKGSRILENTEGTAHAFQFEYHSKNMSKEVFVLPGPPREIESVWKDHISKWLQQNTQSLNRLVTKAWDTLGVGESDVAFKVEQALKERPTSTAIDIGYRVHLPYVEVKLTYLQDSESLCNPWVQAVDKALNEITVTRDFEDVVQKIISKIAEIDFTFYDFLSEGYLHHRLSAALKKLKNWSFKQSTKTDISADFFESEDHFIALLPYENDRALVLFSSNNQIQQKILEAPMKSGLMSERRRQYFSEMALIEFSKTL